MSAIDLRENIEKDIVNSFNERKDKIQDEGNYVSITSDTSDWIVSYKNGSISYVKNRDKEVYLLSRYDSLDNNEFTKFVSDLEESVNKGACFTGEGNMIDIELSVSGKLEKMEKEEIKIKDVRKMIDKRCINQLKNLFSSDVINKIFYSWINDKRCCNVNIDIPYKGDNILVVRSKRYYEPRNNWYNIGYVLGKDKTGFFEHRLKNSNRLKKDNWEREDVWKEMGFDEEYSGSVDMDKRYRVQGDLRMKARKYNDIKNNYILKRLYNHVRRVVVDNVDDFSNFSDVSEMLLPENRVAKFDGEVKFLRIKPYDYGEIEINDTAHENIETIQDKLDVSESEIRLEAERISTYLNEDWQRLSKKRRLKVLSEILIRRIVEKNEELQKYLCKKLKEIETDWYSIGGLEKYIESHKIKSDEGRVMYKDGHVQVILEKPGKVNLEHEEHDDIELNLDRGVYVFDLLDKHTRK